MCTEVYALVDLQDVIILESRQAEEIIKSQYMSIEDELRQEHADREETFRELQEQLQDMKASTQERIDALEMDLSASISMLDSLLAERGSIITDKDAIIAAQHTELEEVSKMIETLSVEFGEMLQQLLLKLKEKVNVPKIVNLDEIPGSVKFVERLRNFSIRNGPT